MTEIKLYVININGESHEISKEVYNRLEVLEKQAEEYKALYLSECGARGKLVDIHADLMMETGTRIMIFEKEVTELKKEVTELKEAYIAAVLRRQTEEHLRTRKKR